MPRSVTIWRLGKWIFPALCLVWSTTARAGYLLSDEKTSTYPKGMLLAQVDDESYDPFSDYSEFDEDSDEEADVYFFKHGRLLTVGMFGGLKGFTDNLALIYSGGAEYGVFLGYFFDLRFALQLGFSTGDYPFTFTTAQNQTTTGNVSFTMIQVNVKYFMNTQNITKGLGDVNPYFIGGIEDVFRTYTISSTTTGGINNATNSTWGIDFGGGVEIPIMKKKAYFGIQGTFHYINFSDANSPVYLYDYATTATLLPTGNHYDILGILGANF